MSSVTVACTVRSPSARLDSSSRSRKIACWFRSFCSAWMLGRTPEIARPVVDEHHQSGIDKATTTSSNGNRAGEPPPVQRDEVGIPIPFSSASPATSNPRRPAGGGQRVRGAGPDRYCGPGLLEQARGESSVPCACPRTGVMPRLESSPRSPRMNCPRYCSASSGAARSPRSRRGGQRAHVLLHTRPRARIGRDRVDWPRARRAATRSRRCRLRRAVAARAATGAPSPHAARQRAARSINRSRLLVHAPPQRRVAGE